MRVKDVMSTTVDSIDASDSISHAASWMAQKDVGALPVLRGGKLAGIVTDRDIVVRGLSAGTSPMSAVEQVMTAGATCCGPESDVAAVLETMAKEKIRRMPVCDPGGTIVGMVSLADLAHGQADTAALGRAFSSIVTPKGAHCQAQALAEPA